MKHLRWFSDTNPWMDCVVTVRDEDADAAREAITEGATYWRDQWENGDGEELYGDCIEDALREAGIKYCILYHDAEDESPAYEALWEASIPSCHDTEVVWA